MWHSISVLHSATLAAHDAAIFSLLRICVAWLQIVNVSRAALGVKMSGNDHSQAKVF